MGVIKGKSIYKLVSNFVSIWFEFGRTEKLVKQN